jgi:hypothetical protein
VRGYWRRHPFSLPLPRPGELAASIAAARESRLYIGVRSLWRGIGAPREESNWLIEVAPFAQMEGVGCRRRLYFLPQFLTGRGIFRLTSV